MSSKPAHKLQRMLAPESVALVGASTTPNMPGNDMVLELQVSRYRGNVYPVNPLYDEVEGWRCYPSIADLPEVPDLVVLGVSNRQLEAQVKLAIEIGAGGLVIFGSVLLAVDHSTYSLRKRVAAMAKEANLPIVGGNCMGFYNVDHWVRAFPFHRPYELQEGGVTLIAQSGSVLTALLWNDQKLRFNLAISPGQELVTTVADYMDYALEQPTTRVIALFLEAVRDPDGFVAALKRAAQARIPVVVLKAGRTPMSVELAKSHSGAIAGNDAAYHALFERYGVLAVDSLDELAATALLLSSGRFPADGGLAAIFDSGGERELFIDLADAVDVPLARINETTTEALKDNIDQGLEPINPLDAWGTGHNYQAIFENCWQALMDDPDTAIGVFVADLTSGFYLHESFARICRRVQRRTHKPVAMLTNHIGTDSQDLACRVTAAGIPVLDGTEIGLRAVRHALAYRDFDRRQHIMNPPSPDLKITARWRARLASGRALSEAEGYAMLADYGVPTVPHGVAESLGDALALAEKLGYPLVLKTAAEGVQHKTDVDGVRVNVGDDDELRQAYEDISSRLGNAVLIAPMMPIDAELALGIVVDPQFGPLIMVAGGGIFIEILKDRQLRLAPVDKRTALRMLDELTMSPVLDGTRGRPPLDKSAVAAALVALSTLAWDLGEWLAELDINPLAVNTSGCMALDVLVIPAAEIKETEHQESLTPGVRDEADANRFNALVLREAGGNVTATIERLTDADLPDGDVLVEVEYSSLNYKDGMALTGAGKIVRSYPMVPGIDFSGRVLESSSDRFAVDDPVILTGWSVGERYWGGFTERQRVRSDWLVRRPNELSSRDAMAIGTAGLTSMLCILAIEDAGIVPDDGPVLVTGAAGGVGSVAVALLAGLGYEVTAVTGRKETHDYLRSLGATAFLTREEMTEPPQPLESETWAAAVDTVGSTMLARVLSQMKYRAVVAACGLAGGFNLPATVMPFIRRGVRLQGIDSVMAPLELRERAWQRLVKDLDISTLQSMTTEVALSNLLEEAPKILAGSVRGRTVVNTRQ
jgi:putative YhdH/YhfP family quinone oxidoreductase